MDYRLEDLIDIPLLQSLQEKLNSVYSFPSAIIDNDGKVLTAVAWQDICTKFHRTNPECEKECIKSDQYILEHLHEANPAVSYQCPHGLVDNATPIIVDGKHLGNFFTGQFFLEKPDLRFFKKQAIKYGFDEKTYLEAVEKVPFWTKEKLALILDFIKGFIEIIAGLCLKNLKEIETRKKVREQEERLTFYTDNSPMAIVEWDSCFVITRWTGEAENIFGWSAFETIGKTIMDLNMIFEDDIPIVEKTIQRLTNGKNKQVISTNRNYRKDRSIITCEWYNTILTDENDKMLSVLSQVLDITERKQAEEHLKVSQQITEGIINSIPARVFWKDKNLVYLGCNTLFANDAGFSSPKDIIGKDDFQMGWSKVAKLYRNDDKQVINSKKPKLDYEESQVTPEGNEINLLTSKTPFLNKQGEVTGIIGAYIDITARKIAELELIKAKESAEVNEAFFKAAMENSQAGIAIAEMPSGKLIYVNKAALMIRDKDYDEIAKDIEIEKYVASWQILHFDGTPYQSDEVPLARAILYGETISREFIVRRDNNEDRYVWANAAPIHDGKGNQIAAIVVFLDITDKKKAEEDIINMKESLEMLNNRLEEIREDERSLIAGEIHDRLGQALTILKIDTNWLIEKTTIESEEGKRLKGMSELLTGIGKEVQRISAELRPPMLDEIGLVAALEWYIEEFEKRTSIKCLMKLDDIIVPDEKKGLVLYRILQEALTNVVRHANAKNVSINLNQAEYSVIMEVIDDGIGIEKEKIDSFKSLGLIGMRERVKKYSGTLDISSGLKKGTKLRVSIPFNEKLSGQPA